MAVYKFKLSEENRFALMVTGGVHLVLLVVFILYTFTVEPNIRPSFIEIQFGEFRSGTPSEYAEERNQEVATRPDPSEVEPEEPQPQKPVPVTEQQTTTEETAKPVDAPDQTEEIQEEEIRTPDTDKIEPKEVADIQEPDDIIIPPKAEQADEQQEGAQTSGDEEGSTGRLNSDQGTGNEVDKSAPYELKWEGDLERSPMVQPLPSNNTGIEATLTIRFEVKPNGTIGRIIPLRKMNPELEREVMQTLRNWRFSRLPSGAPQQSQWGTITFRFVLE